MANLSDEIQRLEDLISELSDPSFLQGHVVAVNDATALLKNRILNEKKDAKGSSFGTYSDTKIPSFFFYGKSLSKSAEDKIKNGDPFASYKDLRKANNLPVDKKNYSFSGEMLQDVGVISVTREEYSSSVTIGGQTERSKKLLKYNSERDDVNLLEPSESEIQLVSDAANERILNVLDKYYE